MHAGPLTTSPCETVLKRMGELGVSCAPKNYHVIYAAEVSGDAQLKSAFDQLVKEDAVTDAALSFLFDTYLFAGIDTGQQTGMIATTRTRTRKIATSLTKSLRVAQEIFQPQEAKGAEQTLLKSLESAAKETRKLNGEILALQVALMTDPLTGVPNRRFFEAELAAVLKEKRPGAFVVFLDVDRFKAINDTHGHGIGDQVLRLIAGRLASQVERPDILARYGGEEFAALLFRDSLGACRDAVETLRADIRAQGIRNSKTGAMIGRITLSAGVTPADLNGTVQDVMDRADALLYRAKTNGRDRIEIDP